MTCGPRRSVKRVIELNVDVSDLITIDHYPQYAFVWLCHRVGSEFIRHI